MRAVYTILIDGTDVTSRFAPYLISVKVSDKAGLSTDTASIELDDTDGQLFMPRPGARVSVMLGWEDEGRGVVFVGTVDEVSARGGRGDGRVMTIDAKGMDTRGKAKEAQHRQFDDATIGEAFKAAAETAGLEAAVDPDLAAIARPYIALDGEGFVDFGERIAEEIGGTFKIAGGKAILVQRNGGKNAAGAALPTITARWGENLHDYDVKPILGRTVEKTVAARWYDFNAAAWAQEAAETGTEGGETTKPTAYRETDQSSASDRAKADAAESDRQSGEGGVTIEGNINAQPEGLCIVENCRAGVDGTYRIDGVDHEYSRGSGFVTRLDLKQPKGGAGFDNR